LLVQISDLPVNLCTDALSYQIKEHAWEHFSEDLITLNLTRVDAEDWDEWRTLVDDPSPEGFTS